MSVNFDFLSAPLKTDDLKAALEVERNKLRLKTDYHSSLKMRLEEANHNLSKIGEKAEFVAFQVAQINALLTPPPRTKTEIASDDIEHYYMLPSLLTRTGLIAGGGALFVLGSGTKLSLKLIGKAPKLSRAAKIAKSTKFLKAAKFAKTTVVLGVALGFLELAVGMISAVEINRRLRNDRAAFEAAIKKADALLTEMNETVVAAETTVREILDDAGFEGFKLEAAMQGYITQMNDAIAELGRQKAVSRMVRKMAIMGLTPQMIAAASELDQPLVDDLLKMLSVEQALARGDDEQTLRRAFKLEAGQLKAAKRIVDARGALVAGTPVLDVVAQSALPPAIIEAETDENTNRLAPLWADIEGEGDLTSLTDQALVEVTHLAALRAELAIKSQLVSGVDPARLAQTQGQDPARVMAWSQDIQEAQDETASDHTQQRAAALRLPLRLRTH